MRIGREEAFDIFRKWEAERALLVCNLGFPLFAAAFRARVSKFSPTELRLLSDDTHSEFAMTFKPDMEFYYEDSRRTPQESDVYECGVLVTFGHDAFQAVEQRDHIGFTEVQ
jgi:hypothetical protein